VLSIYAEIVVLHHLLSDAPMRRGKKNIVSVKIKEKKFASTYSRIIKHMLEANINFPNSKETHK
jgi:hypothetical protein